MPRSFHIPVVSVCDSPAHRVARGLDELIATSPAQARSKVLFSEHLQQKSGSWKENFNDSASCAQIQALKASIPGVRDDKSDKSTMAYVTLSLSPV